MKKTLFTLSATVLFFCNMPCKAQQNNSGIYCELTTTTHTTQMDVNNFTKVYITPSGDMRQETKATLPFFGQINEVTLNVKKDPLHITVINPKTKVYTIQAISPNSDNTTTDETIPVIINKGKVIVNGFPSNALDIIDEGDTTKIWVSNALPGYKESVNVLANIMGIDSNNKLMKLIHEKGYKGSWIKFVSTSSDTGANAVQMVMEITKAKYSDVPESLMKVPAGYTEIQGDPFAVNVHNETKINGHFKAKGEIGK